MKCYFTKQIFKEKKNKSQMTIILITKNNKRPRRRQKADVAPSANASGLIADLENGFD
jgi:hypothetical protein